MRPARHLDVTQQSPAGINSPTVLLTRDVTFQETLMIRHHRFASRTLPAALLSATALLGGCVSYGPEQYSGMSAYRLCDLSGYQRMNLTEASRGALDAELKRRNEDCRTLSAQIARDHEDDRLDRMYNRQSP